MALTKITGKDFKEAVDWLLKEKQGCVHQVLGRTDEGTELCLVIGWADIGYDLEEVKKNGYEDEGYYICSKIGYQHRNNGMQSDFEWDFPMPYNPETGDVWDTDTYVAKGNEQSWQTDADMYNKEAEKIWATWGVPNEDGQTTLDLMESKKKEAKKNTCSMQKKKESLAKVQEMHPMFKNWNPRNQAQVNNTLRLAMAECPQDMPELIKIVKAKGFDVPSGLTPATGWGSFESRSKRQYKECSMSKKKESLAKKSEGFMEDLPYDAPVAIDALCAEIMSHTEEFTIEDATVAEMCGKWYIRNYADGPTAAHNEEEWVEEVTAGLSGSPVDGSPFGAAEAEEYAHQVFKEELAEE